MTAYSKIQGSEATKHASGFSLIEVAIAMMVIGILLIPLVYLYNIKMQALTYNANDAAVKSASMALTKYVLLHGHYPYPASPGSPLGTPTFGHEATKPVTDWPDCQLGSTPDTDVCRTTLNTYTGGAVLVGVLPFADLNLPITSALDSNKYQLSYAVTENLTAKPTFSETGGEIQVIGKDTSLLPVIVDTSVYPGATSRGHFVVINHGVDGQGAFSQAGAKVTACPAPATTKDSENCDRDGTFRSNLIIGTVEFMIYDGPSTDHFDDFVTERNSTASGIWSYQPDATGLNIKDRVGGNVAIGDCDNRKPCIPVARLDVYSSDYTSSNTPAVRADTIKTSRFCPRGLSAGDAGGASAAFSCVDDHTMAVNITGDTNLTTCVGINCPAAAAAWTAVNQPPWFTPEMIAGDPTFGGTPLPEGNIYWMMTTAATHGDFHRGNGILCVGDRAMNGVFDYDEACNTTSYVSNVSRAKLGNCTIAGEYARGITAAGALLCQTPAANN